MSDIVHRIWNKYLGVNTPAAELAKDASAEIESLRRELENERAREIHSCGPDCTRSGCVNRRLREELAEARQEIADRKADCETGHDQDEATIAELRQQLKHMTDEYRAALDAEQVRYRQVVEKDAEIERLKGMVDEIQAAKHVLREHNRLLVKLAASQACEQQLREATECLLHLCEIIGAPDGPVLEKARQALAIPQDTSALEAMITKAGEVMRGRCLRDIWYMPKPQEDAIRALPAVTLDDIK